MKRVILFLAVVLLVCSCSMDSPVSGDASSNVPVDDSSADGPTTVGGSTDIRNVDFNSYSSFSLVDFSSLQTASTSRDFSVNGTVFYGYNYKEDRLEEMTFTTEYGEDFQVYSFKRIGDDYLWLELRSGGDWTTRVFFLVDRAHNKVFDLTNSYTPMWSSLDDDADIYRYKDGIIFRSGAIGDVTIYKLNVVTNEIIPVNNATFDGDIEDFYATYSGHVLGGAFVDNNYVDRFFPADGSAPIISYDEFCRGAIRYKNTGVIGSSTSDCLIDLTRKTIYSFTNEGIIQSPLDEARYPGQLDGRLLVPSRTNKGSNSVVYYKTETGSNIYYTPTEVIHCQLANNELTVDRYPISADVVIDENDYAAVIGDWIIYENTNEGLYAYNFRSGEKLTIYDGRVTTWDTMGDGVSFSIYKSALDIETLYFDLNTRETTHMSDSTVSVTYAVWFPIEALQHEHSFSSEWTWDESAHWHAPLCTDTTEVIDYEPHSIDDAGRCTICGYQHEHTYSEDFEYDDVNHWHCLTCGCTSDSVPSTSGLEPHEFDENGLCICGAQEESEEV